VQNGQRQAAQRRLAVGELQDRLRLLGRLDADDDTVADRAPVSGTVDDDRAVRMAHQCETHRAEQNTAHLAEPPRPQDHHGGVPRLLEQELAGIDEVQHFMDFEVRGNRFDLGVSRRQDLATRVGQGRAGVGRIDYGRVDIGGRDSVDGVHQGQGAMLGHCLFDRPGEGACGPLGAVDADDDGSCLGFHGFSRCA